MKKSPALIQFDASLLAELDTYAKKKGISRNATVNIACTNFIEAERLRNMIAAAIIRKAGAEA